MAEILFDKNFPEALKPQIESFLNEFSWLFPIWLQRLYVGFDAADTDNTAKIKVQKDYRFARLTVCPYLLTNETKIQREDLIHELIHNFISPIKNYALDTIEKLCADNETLFEVVKTELISRNEAVTQDFAYSIAKFTELK